jgi:nucleoside-diphosphate-sugar epimerase
MNILITGGGGFLGALLARTLLRKGEIALAGTKPQPILSVTLADQAAPPADLLADPRVKSWVGELNHLLVANDNGTPGIPHGIDLVFHLAAAVSGECEADFDLGMRSNFAATHSLLEACRALNTRPTVVFASSLAVFGDSPEQPVPPVIEDATLPTPQSSYGIQKYIGEQLVADYGRKGFIRGRSVRLMSVCVRPGKPNGAASGFMSGIIREPLAGVKARCPVPPDTAVALASPSHTMQGLIRAAEASDAQWGPRTALTLPAIRITVGEMAAALQRLAGKAVSDLIEWKPDPAIEKLVYSWPANVSAQRAAGLGLLPDADFDSIVLEYVRENPDAVPAAMRSLSKAR